MKRFLRTPGMLNQAHHLPPPAPHHRVKAKSLIHQDTHPSFYTPLRIQPPNSPRSLSLESQWESQSTSHIPQGHRAIPNPYLERILQ